MTDKVRVNILTHVNMDKVRTEKRNGRDVMVVPSYTLPDNVVMNGIRYPADQIEASYMSLARTPAPFDHPMLNGQYISALDPEAINTSYIGAWNDKIERRDGRVYIEKVIDVEVANSTERGRRVIDAVNMGNPIHTSTGLVARLVNVEDGDVKYEAHDIVFDHDAILLDGPGAATPEDGVGMLVNGEKLSVVNSQLEMQLDDEMDWALQSVVRVMEQQARLPMIARIKQAIVEAFSTTQTNSETEENAEMANEKEFAELQNRVDGLTAKIDGIGEVVANAIKEAMAPVSATMESVANAAKAREDAAKAALVNRVVTAGVLTKEAADTLSMEALTELANKANPKGSKNASPAFKTNGDEDDDEFASYDFNALNEKGAA